MSISSVSCCLRWYMVHGGSNCIGSRLASTPNAMRPRHKRGRIESLCIRTGSATAPHQRDGSAGEQGEGCGFGDEEADVHADAVAAKLAEVDGEGTDGIVDADDAKLGVPVRVDAARA